MPFYFRPDPAAVTLYPWNITFLSQRDAELTIPIPFVTAPGVSISAACFPFGRYEDYSAAKCISNLLAVEFRRIDVDLYWDAGRHVWSFCPVEIPGISQESTSRHSTVSRTEQTTNNGPAAATSTSSSNVPTPPVSTPATAYLDFVARQFGISSIGTEISRSVAFTSSAVSKTTVTVGVSTRSGSTFATIPSFTTTPQSKEVLFASGPFICTRTPALDILTQVLRAYLDATDNTVEAALRYVVLNIHAAASAVAPEAPAQEPDADDLPTQKQSLGNYLSNAFSDYLFTPSTLRSERANLNETWYLATPQYEPNQGYYRLEVDGGTAKTRDGWPSESVLEFQNDNHQRLLIGFGRMDPQMTGYDRSRDERVIFRENYIEDVTERCVFNPNTLTLGSANNSWAVSSVSDISSSDISDSSFDSPLSAVTDIVRCGTSPLLNQSLSDATADDDVLPYKEFTYSSIWSWAWGEPKTRNDTEMFRCAVIDPPSNGRWRVRDCSKTFRAACRIGKHPYRWTISKDSDDYTNARNLCQGDTKFDMPRTALENRYLLHTYRTESNDGPLQPIWIDFNSIEVETCWVSGANATCPYRVNTDDSAQIYVPTIAGLIIVIIAGLLVFVKCGANRRNSRRRRRGADGWDYEGVPS